MCDACAPKLPIVGCHRDARCCRTCLAVMEFKFGRERVMGGSMLMK